MSSIAKIPGWLAALVVLVALLCAYALMTSATIGASRVGWQFFAALSLVELVYFGWLLLLGRALLAVSPAVPPRGVRLATVGLVVAVLYAVVLSSIGGFPQGGRLRAVLVPVHLFAAFSNFYLLFFASRNLVSAELGRPARFGDFLGTFVVLWLSFLFPIGVWWVQARACRIATASGRTLGAAA